MLMRGRTEDNRLMTKERDLLPWILGGLSVTTLAVAVAAVSMHKAVAPLPEPIALAATATPPPAALPNPAPPPAVQPQATVPSQAAMPAQAAVLAQPAEQPEAQAGQIWECVTNGVKTFSNNPCGEKSQLLEVRSVNTMNPTPPPIRYARAPTQAQYASQYAPSYSDVGAPSESQEDYTQQDGAESGADSYTIVQGVAFLPRRRPPQHHHPHRPPYQHSPAQPPRKF
jgi:hypothetical protein